MSDMYVGYDQLKYVGTLERNSGTVFAMFKVIFAMYAGRLSLLFLCRLSNVLAPKAHSSTQLLTATRVYG